jgi:ribosome-binding protein aMBF1 (putative translation factor)
MTRLPAVVCDAKSCDKLAGMAGMEDRSPVSHFGRQVRKERLARGWSLDELAAQTGIAAPHWSRIENGKRGPTEKTAAAADNAFPQRKG